MSFFVILKALRCSDGGWLYLSDESVIPVLFYKPCKCCKCFAAAPWAAHCNTHSRYGTTPHA